MKLPRRKFLQLAAGAAALPAVSRVARAQAYPSRPVHLIVAFPAGGSPDIVARLIGQWLSERLGQPFVVDNRPGGSGNIGTEALVRAPADGYSLLWPFRRTQSTRRSTIIFVLISFATPRRWRVLPVFPRNGSESVRSSKDGFRIHRLCQGQSRQDQHGVDRHWKPDPCCRRAVQDDGRCEPVPRALSW